ncbi:MAG: antibiotic biosynthesis monooxygenase [Sulfuritalea sp.]|jgi:autoinducer 2-degrading protein|nr:antibiotic biosynthesis monooxygenase [Sulfuritalea sp.]
MYVITVEFTIPPEHLAAFMPLMLENARISRETEPGCRRFDVCRDPVRPELVFLYELYDDRAAFDAHLAAAHFKVFDGAVKAMVASKAVHAYELASA